MNKMYKSSKEHTRLTVMFHVFVLMAVFASSGMRAPWGLLMEASLRK